MTRVVMEDPAPDPGSRLPELREALMTEEGLNRISRLVTLGELALCFSHEAKNHLSTVIGNAYMGEQAVPEGDPVRTHFQDISRNGKRINGMISTMLDFGRQREKTKDRCEPEELINESLGIVAPYFANLENPTIAVQIEVQHGCPKVAIDRWEMIHVLVNLLTNAADSMANTRERLVTISAQREVQSMVRIAVADTGSGIAAEDAGRVFTPFFTTKGERGNGLGLFIVRSTIERHGGSITLQTGSCGTVFTICLPTN